MHEDGIFGRMCPHCGTADSRKLGECCVCDRPVCAACGNVQISMGERRVTHNECLSKSNDGFTMIKFVR